MTSTISGSNHTQEPRSRTAAEVKRIERFISSLTQAMVNNNLSQRKLAAAIGVESGTFTKYLRGAVDPFKVGTFIQAALAEQLGVTLDALLSFYAKGTYLSGISVDQVESWIRSEAGQQDLVTLLQALQEAGSRWVEPEAEQPRRPVRLSCYDWPAEVIDGSNLSPAILERLGVREGAVNALIDEGLIDDDLVEGFALLLKQDPTAVREAFTERLPLG